jgi:hypothetical protein
MLLHAVWVKAVNPENWEIDTVADAIGPVVLWKLHDPVEAECAQSRIVKRGGTRDVRDSNAGVIDHGGILRIVSGCSAGRSPLTIQKHVERLKTRDARLVRCDIVSLVDFLVWKVGNQRLLTTA